jgi:hypothetical protein
MVIRSKGKKPMTGLTTTAQAHRKMLIAAAAFVLAAVVWIGSGSLVGSERPTATGTSAMTPSERAYVEGLSRLAPQVLEAAFGTSTDLRRQMGTSSLAGTRSPDAGTGSDLAPGTHLQRDRPAS